MGIYERQFLLKQGRIALKNKNYVLAGLCRKMLEGKSTVNTFTIKKMNFYYPNSNIDEIWAKISPFFNSL